MAQVPLHPCTHCVPHIVLNGQRGHSCSSSGVGVIYDDRDERAGEMFTDADLMGIPVRLVISDKTLTNNSCEIKSRTSDESQMVQFSALVESLEKFLQN